MNLRSLLKAFALTVVAIAIFSLSEGIANADPVTFSTTGVFSVSGTNVVNFTNINGTTTITFNGTTNPVNTPAGASFGDIVVSTTVPANLLGPAIAGDFTLNFFQVSPAGTASLVGTLSGTLGFNTGIATLTFSTKEVDAIDISKGISLPGWDSSYKPEELKSLLAEYADVGEEKLWEHLGYFLKAIVPVAEESGIKMACHPDDPPRPIFGLPRIVKNRDDLARLLSIVDSPANGLTLCSGSLGAGPQNNVEALVREFGGRGRIHFAHLRNVKVNEAGDFEETAHKSECGSLDMAAIVKAYHDIGFEGYARPDHGRMIWGETGKPGYGLYDRALGAVYLNGLWEAMKFAVRSGARSV